MKTAKDEIMSLMRENLKLFEKEYGVSRIGIFGSIAKGTVD